MTAWYAGDKVILCPNPQCELVYRPELVFPFRTNKDGSTDTPPEEYCPKCGVNLEKAAKRRLGLVDE